MGCLSVNIQEKSIRLQPIIRNRSEGFKVSCHIVCSVANLEFVLNDGKILFSDGKLLLLRQ